MASDGTQSIEKALRILRQVAVYDVLGVRLADLVRMLDIEGPTAHRLLKRLLAEDMLTKDARGRYHLGRQVFEFGLLAAHRFEIDEAASAAVQRAADRLGDAVFLNMRTGLEIVCRARFDGDFPIRIISMQVGTRRPLGVGASGVALLAAAPPDEMEAVLKANEARLRRYSPDAWSRVRHSIEVARRTGYAITRGYRTKGTAGIGVAVETGRGVPMFSLSVVGVTSRLAPPRRERIATELRSVAHEIAASLPRAP